MDKKAFKLVVCDIDNTLVVKHQEPSEKTIEAIKELERRNIYFGLASGRSISQLKILSERWKIRPALLIGLNGSEMYDGLTDTTESYYQLDPDSISKILEIMSPFEAIIGCRVNGVSYTNRQDQRTKDSAKYLDNQVRVHVVEDLSEFAQNPVPKMGFRVNEEDMPKIEERVAEFPSEKFKGFKTEKNMFEFTNIHASKGSILRKFCERHGIDLKNVCAFGDTTNDNDLLVTAGTGVCMANGSADTKAIADFITEKPVEEDGCAEYIIQYCL